MFPVRQSTAFETAIGPVLDADGVAVTDCVVGDFKIKKTTGNFAALNGSATLTHVSAGVYDLVLTTSDTDTVGLCCVAIDDTVNACQSLYLQVMEEAVYDALYAASANAWSGAAGSSIGTANVTQFGGSAGTFSGGRPEVNMTHIAGTAWASTTLFTLASHDPGATIGTSTLTQTQVTGGAYALNSASFAFNAAVNNAIADQVWDEDATGHQTTGTFGKAIGDPGIEGDTIWETVVTNLDTTVSSRASSSALATAQADLDIITGANGVIIASGTQTFNMTGSITGSLSGSVGSVTGAVGSVTGNVGGNVVGSVASVTGNVGGNVVGSVASVTGAVGSVTGNVGGSVGSVTGGINTGSGVITTLDALDTAQDTQHGTTQTELAKVPKSDGTATWNATALASIQSEANDAIVANHLDHLLAADYDPTSKPGVSTALLNELIGSDGGVSQFTANALELAPSGGASAADIADAVWDEVLSGHLTAGTTGNALNAAGSSGDPWSTTLPGAYTGSQAGALLDNIYDQVQQQILVSPVAGNSPERITDTTIRTYSGETVAVQVSGLDEDGDTIDWTALGDLVFVVENELNTDILEIENADITKTATYFQVTIPAATNVADHSYRWAIRKVSTKQVFLRGRLICERAPDNDA